MKNVLFLICALALFATGLASVAHAEVPNTPCSHHLTDAANADLDCVDGPTQDQTDLEHCQDCCCICSHVLAGIVTDISAKATLKDSMMPAPHAPLRSNDQSPLYRPPIV